MWGRLDHRVRVVDGVGNQIPVYPGLGFDVPRKNKKFPEDPEVIYHATLKAFEAGAGGLVVSREYDEMRTENLQAVGRAVREVG